MSTLPGHLPTRQLDDVEHVGSLRAADKRAFSWEGHGLSVCYPGDGEEWAAIARLGGHPTWQLHRPGGRFLDFHALSGAQRRAIERWGIESGLAQRHVRWQVSYFDDELGDEMASLHPTLAEAREDAEMHDDPSPPRRRVIVAPTAKLTERMGMRGPDTALDYLAVCWCEDHSELDGVWWEDRYGPMSAPRGAILPGRLPAWTPVRLAEPATTR